MGTQDRLLVLNKSYRQPEGTIRNGYTGQTAGIKINR